MPFIVYYSQCLDSVDTRCCHSERKLSGSFTSSHASMSHLRGWSVRCSVGDCYRAQLDKSSSPHVRLPRHDEKTDESYTAAAAVWRRSSFLFPVPVAMTVGCPAFVRSTSTVVLLPSGISVRIG